MSSSTPFHPTTSFHLTVLCAALAMATAVACARPISASRPSPDPPATAGATQASEARELGTVDFPVSCDEEAQRDVEQALALLHHMMYGQARAAFERAAEEDVDCAMAHWGIAMTLFHPLWGDPPTADELERGISAVARARELGAATERERAYVETVAAYYDVDTRDEGARLRQFERASAELHRSYPDDPDAAAFHALALLATAPPEDATLANQRRAAAILGEVHERHPRHPGAIHYGIHAHDYPALAAEGVYLADVYESIAPDVPHALHMPSHIYVRLGQWRKTEEWNRRSADAAEAQPVDGARSMHYAHAMDYMMYAYLQRMQDDRAAGVIQDIDEATRYELSPAAAYAIAAIHARLPVEQHDWPRAAALSTDDIGARVPWDELPFARAVVVYASGLGAARSGDTEAAARALDELDRIATRLATASEEESGLRYWHVRTQVQRDTLAAWIAHARGEQREARRLMERAADREEAAGKHPIMPGFILPARELLGDLQLEQDRPREALEAYQASLRESPRRANSLYGAARAAEQLGDRRASLDYFVQLTALAADVDAERPILREALDALEAEQRRSERRAER